MSTWTATPPPARPSRRTWPSGDQCACTATPRPNDHAAPSPSPQPPSRHYTPGLIVRPTSGSQPGTTGRTPDWSSPPTTAPPSTQPTSGKCSNASPPRQASETGGHRASCAPPSSACSATTASASRKSPASSGTPPPAPPKSSTAANSPRHHHRRRDHGRTLQRKLGPRTSPGNCRLARASRRPPVTPPDSLDGKPRPPSRSRRPRNVTIRRRHQLHIESARRGANHERCLIRQIIRRSDPVRLPVRPVRRGW